MRKERAQKEVGMTAGEYLYQIGKGTVDALPEWMLRTRPYGVYSIDLLNSDRNAIDTPNGRCGDVAVRWARSAEERSAIATVAASTNLESWNGSTRRALVAWRSNEPIGVAWISSESFEEHNLGLRLELATDEAWLHSAVVVHRHRKQGVYKRILWCAMQTLRDEGCRRVLLGVTTGNEPSQRAHASVGAAKFGRIVAARSCELSFCIVSGQVACRSDRRAGLGRSIDLHVNR